MTDPIHRRRFFEVAAATGLATGLTPRASARGPNESITVGVMGTGGRGTELARGFAGREGVRVAYVCDVDRRRAEAAAGAVAKGDRSTPRPVGDFRRVLDDKDVDALVIATCDHWHAPATILACAAGKHVYVEKPCSHDPREGEMMVAAARKHDRVVQLGTQRRSWPKIIEAIDQLRDGAIGRVYHAIGRYHNDRPTIGRGQKTAAPDWLDFELWQGPAPRQPYRDNILHYNWHWFWDWGTGEIGNNGVHSLDLCRWGLGVDYPIRVSSGGGHYRFDDDQETPDTHVVTFDFDGKKSITFDCHSCNPYQSGPELIYFGEKGTLEIVGGGYAIRDPRGEKVREASGPGGDAVHQDNFLNAIRDGKRPSAEIEEGYKSTLLCHLGNIAYRVGRSLTCDPKGGQIRDDKDAIKLWGREYEPGWEPKV